jgi:hypothetical protein
MVRLAGRAAAVAAALAALALAGGAEGAESAAPRGLQVEAYDPPIPKAPLNGRLETMARHPEDVRPTPPAVSSEPPAASSQAPEPKG